MRTFPLSFSVIATNSFIAGAIAQSMPEVTAPAVLPVNNNQTWMYTPPLLHCDEDYVDESDAAVLAKRSPPAGVYVCGSKNWGGKCKWTAVNDYQCYDYPDSAESSFGVSL
jgi:hypothetical protein